jgi:hypothetical protein
VAAAHDLLKFLRAHAIDEGKVKNSVLWTAICWLTAEGAEAALQGGRDGLTGAFAEQAWLCHATCRNVVQRFNLFVETALGDPHILGPASSADKSAALVELLNVRRTTDVLTKHTPSERVPAVWGIIVERLQVSGRP